LTAVKSRARLRRDIQCRCRSDGNIREYLVKIKVEPRAGLVGELAHRHTAAWRRP